MAVNIPNYIVAALVCVQVGAASIDATKVFLFHRDPYPISGTGIGPDKVRAGETVQIEWTLMKTVDCGGTSSRAWRGANDYLLVEETRPTTIPVSDEAQHYSIATDIPESAPAGQISLTVHGSYNCGDILGSCEFTLGPVDMEVVK